MPLDYGFDSTTGFRDLTHSSLLLLKQPLVRSMRRINRLRRGLQVLPETVAPIKTARLFQSHAPKGHRA